MCPCCRMRLRMRPITNACILFVLSTIGFARSSETSGRLEQTADTGGCSLKIISPKAYETYLYSSALIDAATRIGGDFSTGPREPWMVSPPLIPVRVEVALPSSYFGGGGGGIRGRGGDANAWVGGDSGEGSSVEGSLEATLTAGTHSESSSSSSCAAFAEALRSRPGDFELCVRWRRTRRRRRKDSSKNIFGNGDGAEVIQGATAENIHKDDSVREKYDDGHGDQDEDGNNDDDADDDEDGPSFDTCRDVLAPSNFTKKHCNHQHGGNNNNDGPLDSSTSRNTVDSTVVGFKSSVWWTEQYYHWTGADDDVIGSGSAHQGGGERKEVSGDGEGGWCAGHRDEVVGGRSGCRLQHSFKASLRLKAQPEKTATLARHVSFDNNCFTEEIVFFTAASSSTPILTSTSEEQEQEQEQRGEGQENKSREEAIGANKKLEAATEETATEGEEDADADADADAKTNSRYQEQRPYHQQQEEEQQPSCRSAVCVSGQWRTFSLPKVRKLFREHLVKGLSGEAWAKNQDNRWSSKNYNASSFPARSTSKSCEVDLFFFAKTTDSVSNRNWFFTRTKAAPSDEAAIRRVVRAEFPDLYASDLRSRQRGGKGRLEIVFGDPPRPSEVGWRWKQQQQEQQPYRNKRETELVDLASSVSLKATSAETSSTAVTSDGTVIVVNPAKLLEDHLDMAWPALESVKGCFDLVKASEDEITQDLNREEKVGNLTNHNKRRFKYDWVVRTRFDLTYLWPIAPLVPQQYAAAGSAAQNHHHGKMEEGQNHEGKEKKKKDDMAKKATLDFKNGDHNNNHAGDVDGDGESSRTLRSPYFDQTSVHVPYTSLPISDVFAVTPRHLAPAYFEASKQCVNSSLRTTDVVGVAPTEEMLLRNLLLLNIDRPASSSFMRLHEFPIGIARPDPDSKCQGLPVMGLPCLLLVNAPGWGSPFQSPADCTAAATLAVATQCDRITGDQGRGIQYGAWMRNHPTAPIGQDNPTSDELNSQDDSTFDLKDEEQTFKERIARFHFAVEEKMIAFLNRSAEMEEQHFKKSNGGGSGDTEDAGNHLDGDSDTTNKDAGPFLSSKTTLGDSDHLYHLPSPHTVSLGADATSGQANDPLISKIPREVHITFHQHEEETLLARSFLGCLFVYHLTWLPDSTSSASSSAHHRHPFEEQHDCRERVDSVGEGGGDIDVEDNDDDKSDIIGEDTDNDDNTNNDVDHDYDGGGPVDSGDDREFTLVLRYSHTRHLLISVTISTTTQADNTGVHMNSVSKRGSEDDNVSRPKHANSESKGRNSDDDSGEASYVRRVRVPRSLLNCLPAHVQLDGDAQLGRLKKKRGAEEGGGRRRRRKRRRHRKNVSTDSNSPEGKNFNDESNGGSSWRDSCSDKFERGTDDSNAPSQSNTEAALLEVARRLYNWNEAAWAHLLDLNMT